MSYYWILIEQKLDGYLIVLLSERFYIFQISFFIFCTQFFFIFNIRKLTYRAKKEY